MAGYSILRKHKMGEPSLLHGGSKTGHEEQKESEIQGYSIKIAGITEKTKAAIQMSTDTFVSFSNGFDIRIQAERAYDKGSKLSTG